MARRLARFAVLSATRVNSSICFSPITLIFGIVSVRQDAVVGSRFSKAVIDACLTYPISFDWSIASPRG